MTTAFVLSGGGSRGDFQLGAMLALKQRGIVPDIICSTSVGSINALMAAQGEDGIDELSRIWLGLRRNDHMWQWEDWWAEVNPQLRDMVVQVVNGTGAPAASSEPWAVHSSLMFGAAVGTIAFGPGAFLAGALAGGTVGGLIQNVTADAIKDAFRLIGTRARALLNLDPIRAMFDTHFRRDRFDAWVAGGGRLRLACVGLNSGALGYVTERGELLDRGGAVVAGGISVLDGAMASASIAAVFPPVGFAGDWWVDGGHREDLPLKIALQSGADRIYVISCSPVDPVSSVNRSMETPQPPDGPRSFPEDYAQARVLAIAPRALLTIHLDEMAADDLYPLLEDPAGSRIAVIAPTYPTHDITTIDPELVRVNLDYGWRVACDVLDGADAAAREDSDQIALAAGKIGRDRAAVLHAVGMPWSARTPGLRDLIAAARDRRAAAGRQDGAGLRDALPVGSELMPGDRLLPGQAITSPDGRMRLIYQSDGNLVLYDDARGGGAVWANDRMGSALGCVVMQRDGNLVCYDDLNRPLWASDTSNLPGAAVSSSGLPDTVLRLQNDGRAAIYAGNRQIWSVGRRVVVVPPVTPNTPGTDTTARQATIRNAGPAGVHVTIYKVDDTVHLTPLPGGLFDLGSGSERVWTFPDDVGQATVLVNMRHSYTAVPGGTVVHSADDRIQLVNRRGSSLMLRLFNSNDILRIVALPGGEIDLPPNGTAFYDLPGDIERVAIMAGGHEVGQARRGERVEVGFDPRVYVRNDWDRPVALKFYKADDVLRWATLPGGAPTVQPGATLAFTVPGDVTRVQVWGNGQRADANPGDTLAIAAGRFSLVV